MSEEELQEKALGLAKHTLSGKTDLEKATVLHQHIGSRAMGDMVIETFEPSPGEYRHDNRPQQHLSIMLLYKLYYSISLNSASNRP